MRRRIASQAVRCAVVALAMVAVFPTLSAGAAPRPRDGSVGGGGKTTTFSWSTYGVSIANPVEQWVEWPFPSSDKWVSNPTSPYSAGGPCAWDVDDHWYVLGSGPVTAGQTVSLDQCRIADPNPIRQTRYGNEAWWTTTPRYTGIRIESPSADLQVQVSYNPQGRTFTLPPTYDSSKNTYVYRGCIGLEYRPNDPAWPHERDEAVQPIAGSNGGWGVITRASVTIKNPTDRKVSATGKVEEISAWLSDATVANFCSARRGWLDEWQHEYPFQFSLD